MTLSRRTFLSRSSLLGCSIAASPLMTPVTFASAPWDRRLVVVILRGAMDGLDVVQPYGDPDFAGYRRTLLTGEAAGAHDLDGFYALHPAMGALMPLWRAGQLGFVQAVSTPYRDKRSHFDGQDILEAGTPGAGVGTRDGWLNRMLQSLPGIKAETTYAIGREELRILQGRAPVSSWSPDSALMLTPQSRRLLEMVYHDDPLFRDAVVEALQITDSLTEQATDMAGGAADAMMAAPIRGDHMKIAEFAAGRLREETRIASFSINGWDTHGNQSGLIARRLKALSEVILTLHAGLGPVWDKTAILAMTEFGRTVAENGTGGTDHGTGGAMIMAGGALRGGRVYGDWPGLSAGALYQGRDLMPTADVRDYAAAAMQGLFGLDTTLLETVVFPSLSMKVSPRLIL